MTDNILIKSIDRSSGTSSDFIIDANTYKLDGTYILKYALIPNGFYNVNAYNSIFDFAEGGGAITVTLTQGNYDTTTFATLLANALTAATGTARTYTVTISSSTNKITISNDLSGNTSFDFTNYPYAKNLLGFTTTIVAATHPVNGDAIVDLSAPTSIGIDIKESQDKGYLNCSSQNCGSLYVPLNKTFGSYLSLSNTDLPQTCTFTNKRNISIRIIDTSTNKSLNLNGLNFEILLTRISS